MSKTGVPAIRIGVSSCLLGQKVRYDGNHKHDRYVTDALGEVFELIPVCPEVGIGMSVPRPPIRLVGDPEAPRAVGVKDPDFEVTDQLRAFGAETARRLDGISGYLFKAKSPSCGVARVPVYGKDYPRHGTGLHARAIMDANPLLPVEDEGRLNDAELRDNFLERVFAYHRWQQMLQQGLTPGRLVAFHTIHKLSTMAHGPEHYRSLGRLVAGAGKGNLGNIADDYAAGLMKALGHKATRRRHTNVLHHLMGYLKKHISAADKQELNDLIDRYRLGEVPRIAPVTLLRHHFLHHPHEYVERQLYLYPDPDENRLRSPL